jgi:hypothetical protein
VRWRSIKPEAVLAALLVAGCGIDRSGSARDGSSSALAPIGWDGIPAAMDLRVESDRWVGAERVVRYRRHAFGLPVQGRTAVMRVSANGSRNPVIAELGAPRLDPRPLAADPAAIGRAADADEPDAIGVRSERVAIDRGRWIERGVAVYVDLGSARPMVVRLYDREGTLLARLPRATSARGRVYVPNPVVAMNRTRDEELGGLVSADSLTGARVRARSCDRAGGLCAAAPHARPDEAGDYLFEPDEPSFVDPFAEVSAYFHAERALSYFDDRHGFEWSCACGDSAIEVVANYTLLPDVAYDNALFEAGDCASGRCPRVLLGQGMHRDYAYDGDIAYHELTHAVVEALAPLESYDVDPLGVSYEPAAIEEGLADFFSSVVAGDPRVGEYVADVGEDGAAGALRGIDGDERCPWDLTGDPHRDGRIVGGALWSLRTRLGPKRAEAIAFRALAAMPEAPSLRDVARVLEASVAPGDPSAAVVVRDVIERRGLLDCERIVPLDDGEARFGVSGSSAFTAALGAGLAPTHYRIELPPDAQRVTLRLDPVGRAGRYTLFLRLGRPVEVDHAGEAVVQSDHVLPFDRLWTLGRGGDLALPSCGGTLFVALRAEDLAIDGPSAYEIHAVLERGDAGHDDAGPCEPPDGGVPDAGPPGDAGTPARAPLGGGGCRCDLSTGSRGFGAIGSGPLAVTVVVLACRGWRRRRATSRRDERGTPRD